MARIRTVKPELFRHEELQEAELDTGLPLRLSFIGLFTCCDREGRFKWRPQRLKLDVLPYDEIDFSRVLDALWTRGFIVRYLHKGKEYGCIPTFSDHQVINNREKESELPDFYDALSETLQHNDNEGELTREPRVSHADLEERQGNMEGKGREGNMERNMSGKPDAIAVEILDFLNEKTGKSYKAAKTNLEHINARLRDGYTLEQFKHAISVKVEEWKGTDMEMYLRPTTLFNSKKFDGYVNQPIMKSSDPGHVQENFDPGPGGYDRMYSDKPFGQE